MCKDGAPACVCDGSRTYQLSEIPERVWPQDEAPPRSGTDTAAEPLLSSRHNSGALETVRVAESIRVQGAAYRATSCCERRPCGNELRVGRMSALAISRFVMSVTDHMIASCM